MKGIYSTFIFIAIISIFSLQTSAQNGSAHGLPNGTVNGRSNGTENGSINGTVSSVRDFRANKRKASPVTNEGAVSVSIDPVGKEANGKTRINLNSADEDQIKYFYGVPAPHGREIDRYGYQGAPLSDGTRPCLVAGARRCVQ